jgi:hypothetical protein
MKIILDIVFCCLISNFAFCQKTDSSYIVKITSCKKFKREIIEGEETQKLVSKKYEGTMNISLSDLSRHHYPVEILLDNRRILLVKVKEQHDLSYLFGMADDDKTQVTLDIINHSKVQLVLSDANAIYVYNGTIAYIRVNQEYE